MPVQKIDNLNVNAITGGKIIFPDNFKGQIVCTLPKVLGQWMSENKLTEVFINEYGFKTIYRLDSDGWAKSL